MTQAYLYKWVEKSTQKWYIGSRTKKNCHPNDGYICSSKTVLPLIKTNPNNWTRQILCISNPSYIRELESLYLIKLDAKNDLMSYNLHNNNGKFFTNLSLSAETRAKMSATRKGKPQSSEHKANRAKAQTGKKRSPEICAKLSTALKTAKAGKPGTFTGKTHTEETKQKIRDTLATLDAPCPHCGKIVSPKHMGRWHGAKCKLKPLLN